MLDREETKTQKKLASFFRSCYIDFPVAKDLT